jgi:hypothetical protein
LRSPPSTPQNHDRPNQKNQTAIAPSTPQNHDRLSTKLTNDLPLSTKNITIKPVKKSKDYLI